MSHTLYAVRPNDSELLMLSTAGSWIGLGQISASAAASWALGNAIGYSIAPWRGGLAIFWSDPAENGGLGAVSVASYDLDTGLIQYRDQVPNTGSAAGPEVALSYPEAIGPSLRVFALPSVPRGFLFRYDLSDSWSLSRVDEPLYEAAQRARWVATTRGKDGNCDLAAVGELVAHAHLFHHNVPGTVLRSFNPGEAFITDPAVTLETNSNRLASEYYGVEVDVRKRLDVTAGGHESLRAAFPGISRRGGWFTQVRNSFSRFNYPRRQMIASASLRNRLYHVNGQGELVVEDLNRDTMFVVSDLVQNELAPLTEIPHTFTVPFTNSTHSLDAQFMYVPRTEWEEHVGPWTRYNRIRALTVEGGTANQQQFLTAPSGFLEHNSRLIRVVEGVEYIQAFPWQFDWKQPFHSYRDPGVYQFVRMLLPMGSTWKMYRGLLGYGHWTQDLAEQPRRCYGSFMFESGGALWLVYLSASKTPNSSKRVLPFVARMTVDDSDPLNVQLSSFSYWVIEESPGVPINGAEFSKTVDWEQGRVHVLYRDPETTAQVDSPVKHFSFSFASGVASIVHHGLVYSIPPAVAPDHRNIILPGSVTVADSDLQPTGRVVSVEYDRFRGVTYVTYELSSKEPTTCSVTIDFDVDDFDRSPDLTPPKLGFRPATPRVGDPRGGPLTGREASPSGTLHTYAHDLIGEGLSNHDGYVQYRLRVFNGD